jgi:hypothetical protein
VSKTGPKSDQKTGSKSDQKSDQKMGPKSIQNLGRKVIKKISKKSIEKNHEGRKILIVDFKKLKKVDRKYVGGRFSQKVNLGDGSKKMFIFIIDQKDEKSKHGVQYEIAESHGAKILGARGISISSTRS